MKMEIFSKNEGDTPCKINLCYNLLMKNKTIIKRQNLNLLYNFREIEIILDLKHKKEFLKFLYFNRQNIEDILYNEDKLIEIKEEDIKKEISDYFYLSLLIKSKKNIINYSYSIQIIKDINERKKFKDNIFQKIIISKFILDLIDNYKGTDNYDEEIEEEVLNNIYKENIETIKSNINEFNYNLKQIKAKNIDELYLDFILDLIKTKKYRDINLSNQLELKNINITETIKNGLFNFLDNTNNIESYNINQIEQIFNDEILNFFYFLFKFILKEQIFIYQSKFLTQTRNFVLKKIKVEKEKFFKCYESCDEDNKNKIKFILELILQSDYYLNKIINNNLNNQQQEEIRSNNDNNDNNMNIPRVNINTNNSNNINGSINESSLNIESNKQNSRREITGQNEQSSSNPFSNTAYKNQINNSHRHWDNYDNAIETEYQKSLIQILTNSTFQFHTNEKDEDIYIIYDIIEAGGQKYKKIEDIKEMVLDRQIEKRLLDSYFKFTSFLNNLETKIKNNYKKKDKAEITLNFQRPENLDNNSTFYEIDCLYKLNLNNNISEFVDENYLNNKELEGINYLLNEMNNEV